jgi:DNA repair protein RadC
MAPYAAREVAEVFWIIALDAQHRAIGNAPIAITRGTLIARRWSTRARCSAPPSSRVRPRSSSATITRAATRRRAQDDRIVTDMLVEAGRLLDIPMHDHVICGTGRYVSFAEAGCI